MPQATCTHCGNEIPAERLEAIPNTTQCTSCAAKYPKVVRHDPEIICARASTSCRNGFGSSD